MVEIRERSEAHVRAEVRKTPPPIPKIAREKIKRIEKTIDSFHPGAVFPRHAATLGWANPALDAHRLERAQAHIEARALKTGDAKSWYTTAAFEIKRADVTGDKRFLLSALISLDFAERGANKFLAWLRGEKPANMVYIKELRRIIQHKLSSPS